MSEYHLQHKVLKALESLDAIPVENSKKPGTPDINYIGGDIELKYLKAWPKRERTKIKFPKFTPQQRVRLHLRSSKGGKCYVFIQIADFFLIYEGGFAAEQLGKMDTGEMLITADKVWRQKFPYQELLDFLKPTP
jgi:hypothetical protein